MFDHSTPTGLFCAAALAFGLPAMGQDWVRQSPYPADTDLLGVHFTSSEIGWITGRDDLLMQTSDGGETWQQTGSVVRDPMFTEDPIWDVQFVDELNGFAAGNFIYRTTDGGETWDALGSQGTVYGIDFPAPETGYLWGNLSILRTDDAGASFTMVWNWEDRNFISDVDFLDTDTGLVAGEQDDVPGVFRTTNRGQTWERISSQALGEIRYLTPNVVIGVNQASFYRSTDGGVTWTLVYSENTQSVNSIEALAQIDANSIAAIDINARIWVSDDAGTTWTRTHDALGNWGYEWDIQFPDANTGYAVGRGGIILKSSDGGHSWQQINRGVAVSLDDIEMRETGVGIAVGERGTVLRTTDFGGHWTVQRQLTVDGRVATDLHEIQAIDDETFVLVGHGGAVFRSDDAGLNWNKLGSFSFGIDFFDVSFVDANNGWVFGRLNAPYGIIARTTDGGETWDVLQGAGDLYVVDEGQMIDLHRGFALLPQTVFLNTRDGFETFSGRELPSGDSFQSMEFADARVGWVVGFFGDVRKTVDGGVFFDAQTLPGFRWQDNDRALEIHVTDTRTAHIATMNSTGVSTGTIYTTESGGSSWTALNSVRVATHRSAGNLAIIDVLPGGGIWTGGSFGHIFTSYVPVEFTPADLTDFQLVDGTLLGGGLPALVDSDDVVMGVEARVTGEVAQPHLITLVLGAATENGSASDFHITFESRITDIEASVALSLRDWQSGELVPVGSFTVGMSESVREIDVSDASRFVRATDGRIELHTTSIVLVPFTLGGYHMFIDQIQVGVR